MTGQDSEETLRGLLTCANEDCTPFWDAVWEVAGHGDDADSDARYRATTPEAQRLMRLLLFHGLISVYRVLDHDSGPGANGEFKVPEEEASAIVADPRSWRRPSDEERLGVYFCFYATEAGKQLWYKGRNGIQLPEQIAKPPVSEVALPAP